VTDRFGKAITQLASDKIEERVGGIYALEHVMMDSERDHQTIVDVLSSFIRERAHRPNRVPLTDEPLPKPSSPELEEIWHEWHASADDEESFRSRPPADVQAALTVLARRPERHENAPLDLHEIYAPNARLQGARFRGADLRKAHLEQANLAGAQLQGADLNGAQLQWANLIEARLQKAMMSRTSLEYAHMTRARFNCANLNEANLLTDLSEVDFDAANLHGAQLDVTMLQDSDLTAMQINSAAVDVDEDTSLPYGLTYDPVKRRVVEGESK
jgi:hypothetical protein